MPQSLVLSLETQSTVSSSHLQGHALQQLFFTLVDNVDPELGHVLRRDKKNCSYTLSAIQIGPAPGNRSPLASASSVTASPTPADRKQKANLNPGPLSTVASLQYVHTSTLEAYQKCWWRISFLDDALFDHFVFLWSQLSNEIFPLGSASVKVEHIYFEAPGTDWSASCSYRDLYEQASAQEPDIHLQFLTPTAFNLGEAITPLPTADAIFQHLRKYWNRYSGLVFAPSITDTIVPIDFDIQAQPVQIARRHSFQTLTGCTGHVSFRIGGHSDPLITKRLNALANFTQYCGVGVNTRLGMGVMTRCSGRAAKPTQQNKAHIKASTATSRPTA